MAYIVDADGERQIVRVMGWDRSDPTAIYECWQEIRPGGMVVVHALDNRPITVSEPAPLPTAEEIQAGREARAAEYQERERQAREQETASAQIKKDEIARKKAERKAALEAAAEERTPAA